MATQRPDGIEEEPFELDLGEVAEPPPKKKASRVREPAAPEEEPPEDEGLEQEEEAGRPELLLGLSPTALKAIAAGVAGLAVLGVVVALALRSSWRRREAAEMERALLARGATLAVDAARMAVEYFVSGKKRVPPEFYTRFREPDVVQVIIQEQPAGSVTFEPRVFALNRQFAFRGETPQLVPKPLPGTEVYATRGRVIIDFVEYPVRIFRQTLKDTTGKVVGRVAVILFDQTVAQ